MNAEFLSRLAVLLAALAARDSGDNLPADIRAPFRDLAVLIGMRERIERNTFHGRHDGRIAAADAIEMHYQLDQFLRNLSPRKEPCAVCKV